MNILPEHVEQLKTELNAAIEANKITQYEINWDKGTCKLSHGDMSATVSSHDSGELLEQVQSFIAALEVPETEGNKDEPEEEKETPDEDKTENEDETPVI